MYQNNFGYSSTAGLTPTLTRDFCEDNKPENRYCGKLYRLIDCIFLVIISKLIFTPNTGIKIFLKPIFNISNIG